MQRALWFFLSLIFGLLLINITLDPSPFLPPAKETVATAPRDPGQPLSEAEYKRLKMALSSFDLANGLTRQDFERMPEGREHAFYFLLGAFWLVLGLKTLGKPRRVGD
ncbi:MAG: hypothetical protein WHT07_10495 [Desulfobaccales bacterium]